MKFNPINIPTIDELKKVIIELQNTDLSKISYNKLWSIIENEIRVIPFMTAKLNKGHYIDRGRINKDDNEIFNSEKDISYREDSYNIHNFGRANPPYISMFYGAVKSSTIEHPRIINLLETSEIFRNMPDNRYTDANFKMTLGKWIIKEDFEVLDIIYNKYNRENIPEIKNAYSERREELYKEHPNEAEQLELVLEFFSDEFSKKDVKSHHDYKISTVYTQMALLKGLHGVSYPSVRTQYLGNNVAITPFAIDKYCELEKAAMFQIDKSGDNTLVGNLKIALNLGPYNTNFQWVSLGNKTEGELNEIIEK
ncbi:MAG TPA: hypothetical protein PKD85_11435 [Saprospiraceae bacterium]|nr:hypothetical protein [Saprospiraceae bacterium]